MPRFPSHALDGNMIAQRNFLLNLFNLRHGERDESIMHSVENVETLPILNVEEDGGRETLEGSFEQNKVEVNREADPETNVRKMKILGHIDFKN